jgi:hypothetical protein
MEGNSGSEEAPLASSTESSDVPVLIRIKMDETADE